MCVTLSRGKYGETVGFGGGRSLGLTEKERAREMGRTERFGPGLGLNQEKTENTEFKDELGKKRKLDFCALLFIQDT